jgi:hypothetical protein
MRKKGIKTDRQKDKDTKMKKKDANRQNDKDT